MSRKLLPKVEVEWHDTMGYDGWKSKEERLDVVRETNTLHRSLGYLLEHTDKYICIAMSLGDDTGTTGETLRIPIGCVEHINKLKRGKK